MIASSLASISRPLWRLLEYHDIDPEFVFREVRLDPKLMDEPRGRYRVERLVAAWAKAAELIDDPCFGLKVAEVWSPTDLHALGYAFLASSTLRTALGRLSRYVRVIDNVVAFDLDDEGEHVSITFKGDHPVFLPPLPAEEDAMWAFITSLCRASSGQKLNPVEVRLLHSEPSCKGDYYGFFRCPIRFDSDLSSVLFAQADVDRPLPAANRELAHANDRILSELLARVSSDGLIPRLKAAIIEELPSGSPSETVIAKAFCMSRRTLQRKLASEGTSYGQVLDAVRRELAEQYVADPTRSLGDISYLLGFSEVSAFSRAFKRWTGTAPSDFRDQAL